MATERDVIAEVPAWDVADRMRKALRHAGLGVGEMANYLDVGRNTVSTWINGRITPSTQTLRLWAQRCDVPYEWLTEGADPAAAARGRGSTHSYFEPLQAAALELAA